MGRADTESNVVLQPARTGRPRTRTQNPKRNESVLVSARVPATLAAKLFEVANDSRRPVSTLVTEFLSVALEESEVSSG